ncbi:MAG: inositol monophosphatase [Nitrospirae bacterium]|nr:inositol monophosphatase [Nitrospirota bacterium]
MVKTKTEDLLNLFNKIRTTLNSSKHAEAHGKNPKGDISRGFDLLAEQIIFAYCREFFTYSINIFSEESGNQIIGSGCPIETWVIDPVDGSENFLRNLGISGLSIAVLPYGDTINSNRVEIGLMGNIVTGYAIIGQKGKGSFDSAGQRISVSKTTRLSQAIIGCDLNFKEREFDNRLIKLISLSRDIRRMGSTVSELMFVAVGGYDGYVDVRGQLTAEDFMAASCVIRESGGIITDINGSDWGDIADLTSPKTIIAAATSELHKELLNLFK